MVCLQHFLNLTEIFIIKSLTLLLINQIINIGILPDILKRPKIVPIFKNADPSVFINYRPFFTPSNYLKVLEKISS